MSREQLKNRWRDLYRAGPPAAFTSDLLARGIAWRLQEKELGGLPPQACQMLGGSGEAAPRRRLALARVSLRPGNRLVRRWRGRTYVVEVTDGGLIYEEERFVAPLSDAQSSGHSRHGFRTKEKIPWNLNLLRPFHFLCGGLDTHVAIIWQKSAKASKIYRSRKPMPSVT